MNPRVMLSRSGRVLVATLARPPVNALDDALLLGIDHALTAAAADDAITVLHLRSSSSAFCAGADLGVMQSCFAREGGTDDMVALVQRMQQVFTRLDSAPVITLAEIGGAAIGGGLELALACDLRVAALTARLGLSEARLGLLPAAGGTQRLTRLVGVGVAKRLILGAEIVDGAEAARLGIVQWTCEASALPEWTAALAARVAALPKAALLANKRCIAAEADPWSDGFAEELAATRHLYQRDETRRKVAAFLAKAPS